MRALFGSIKLYLFGALLAAAGFAYWYHGHVEYKAGKLAGDKEVAALKGQYATAYANATAAANKRAAQSEWHVSVLRDTAQAAIARSDDFAAKLKEARKHDPATAALLDTPLPASVRAAGEGGSR